MADKVTLRHPTIDDGKRIARLAARVRGLETQSSTFYLLWARDFPGTSVVAAAADGLAGFALGYRPPGRENAVFLWQIGVRPASRAQRVGAALMAQFLSGPGATGAHVLEACLPPSHQAGHGLLRHVADGLGAELTREPCLSANQFPEPGRADEELVRIGPYDPAKTNAFLRQEVESWK